MKNSAEQEEIPADDRGERSGEKQLSVCRNAYTVLLRALRGMEERNRTERKEAERKYRLAVLRCKAGEKVLSERYEELRDAVKEGLIREEPILREQAAKGNACKTPEEQAERIRNCPFFDEKFYLAQCPDCGEARRDPAKHYLQRGGFEGKDPSPGFDSAWYLKRYPDIMEAGMNPLLHYLLNGAKEGRFPHPEVERMHRILSFAEQGLVRDEAVREELLKTGAFEPASYLERNPDVKTAGKSPLTHYLETGSREGRDPGTDFDCALYEELNPDLKGNVADLFAHYLIYGILEGRPVRGRKPDLSFAEELAFASKIFPPAEDDGNELEKLIGEYRTELEEQARRNSDSEAVCRELIEKIRPLLAQRDRAEEEMRAGRTQLRELRKMLEGPGNPADRIRACTDLLSRSADMTCEATEDPGKEEKEEELISVILPVYNQAELLRESVESILAQTWKNWELIVLNDGSTDHADQVMSRYAGDPRVHYLVQPNGKLPRALSHAFRFARGRFLTWTSADNRMRPEMLSRLAGFLRKNPDCDMVYADYAIIDAEGNPTAAPWFRPNDRRSQDSPELSLPCSTELLNLVKDNFIGASFLYRREVLTMLGDYDAQLGVEDYDYWMRLNRLGKIRHLDGRDVLYEYRLHGNSLSGKAEELKILEKSFLLMERERKRAAFFRKPFQVFGSFRRADFEPGGPDCDYPPGRPGDKPDPDGKRVLLLKGRDLSEYPEKELRKYDFTAAFFEDGDALECARYAVRLRREGIFCCAPAGSLPQAMLSMLLPDPGECGSRQFGGLALKRADDFLFRHSGGSRIRLRVSAAPAPPAGKSGPIFLLMDDIGTGGMEQAAGDMAAHFVKAGRPVTWVCMGDHPADFTPPEGVAFRPLAKDRCEEEFSALLKAERPDAVIAHYAFRGAKETSALGIPFYQVLHNSYVWFTEERKNVCRATEPFTRAFFAVSASVAADAVLRLGLPPEKIVVLENGISFDAFQASPALRARRRAELGLDEKEFLLLNPASCYGVKGQLHLIHAFAEALKCHPELRLVMAGKIMEESYAERIRSFIGENGLEGKVTFGRRFEDMNSLYNAADAVVCASFWEGSSLAVAEAVRCGKPVISTITGEAERQTAAVPHILIELPFRYLSQLNPENMGLCLYTPNEQLIDGLRDAMCAAAEGRWTEPSESAGKDPDRSAAAVYGKYLRALKLLDAGFEPEAVRHNLDPEITEA